MTILLFFVVLFVLILVHEWGHFIVAKKTGMRVDEFGIGFPPRLFGVRRGETEYTFNALPIGGFVRIYGENYEEPDDSTSAADRTRSFSARPRWAQALVLIAGVAMNVLFAWFLFSATFMIGVPTAVEESVATESARLVVSEVVPDSPASVIPVGAHITQVQGGTEIVRDPTPSEFSAVVRSVGAAPLQIEYQYADATESITLTPETGLIESAPERYAVGAALALVEEERRGPFAAIVAGGEATINGLQAIVVGLYTLISQSLVGQADFSQVAGPVGIVSMVGDAASFGLTALLTFTAIISLNLAVINLLPVPALDGGRLVFVGIEAITGREIPPEWAGRVNLIGFALLMLLMIAVTYNDIVRLL